MQLLDVGRMQAGGGLVDDIQRLAALRALQFRRQLDALRLASRQFGGGLAQPQIAQADILQQPSGRITAASSAKNSHASSTVIASTSAMFLSRYESPGSRRCSACRGRSGTARRRWA